MYLHTTFFDGVLDFPDVSDRFPLLQSMLSDELAA